MKMKILAFATIGTCLLACGSSAVPRQQVVDSKAALAAAQAVNASQHPKGALHIKLAEQQIQTAEELIEEDENERAKMALERAQADAEVALAHARAEEARARALAAQRRVEELRRRLQDGPVSSRQGGGA